MGLILLREFIPPGPGGMKPRVRDTGVRLRISANAVQSTTGGTGSHTVFAQSTFNPILEKANISLRLKANDYGEAMSRHLRPEWVSRLSLGLAPAHPYPVSPPSACAPER